MLVLDREHLLEINALGAKVYPYEGCGLLLGEIVEGDNVIKALYPTENRWAVEEEKRERFNIMPEDMLQAELAAMTRDLEVIGVFHSHPDCDPVASPRDLVWAAWAGYSYLITAVRNAQPEESRSWQLLPDRSGFIEETIQITNALRR